MPEEEKPNSETWQKERGKKRKRDVSEAKEEEKKKQGPLTVGEDEGRKETCHPPWRETPQEEEPVMIWEKKRKRR